MKSKSLKHQHNHPQDMLTLIQAYAAITQMVPQRVRYYSSIIAWMNVDIEIGECVYIIRVEGHERGTRRFHIYTTVYRTTKEQFIAEGTPTYQVITELNEYYNKISISSQMYQQELEKAILYLDQQTLQAIPTLEKANNLTSFLHMIHHRRAQFQQ